MPRLGKSVWGGLMLKEINYQFGVETFEDVLLKVLPKIEDPVVEQKERELENAKEQQEQKKQQQQAEKDLKRIAEEGDIQGFDSPESTLAPDTQPGASLDGRDITRSWFVENFGMSSDEIIDVLNKSQSDLGNEALTLMAPLIAAEHRAILKHFSSEALYEELPLNDSDYSILNKRIERLSLPFRRFLKSWRDSQTDEERENAYDQWSQMVNKSERISSRESAILAEASQLLMKNGLMDAKGLIESGVPSTAPKLANLIKNHGWLFDIEVAGKGTKSNQRGLFYDMNRGSAIIKNSGRFIGSLWEADGRLEVDSRGVPRLVLPFSSVNATNYVETLKGVMSVSAVKAEGSSIVFMGDGAVLKACEMAHDFLKEKRAASTVIQKAIKGDERAIQLFAYQNSVPAKQVNLLKKWKMTQEDLINEVLGDE